jgi:hypothetical protein
MSSLYAPGARVLIRDCEWFVRWADASDDGGYILKIDGLSELVNGKIVCFLTKLEELLTIYRVQFPVMRQYEAETWYDQTGRIVFTPSKGLVGVGLPRKANKKELTEGTFYCIDTPERKGSPQDPGIALGWEDIQHLQEGSVFKTYMDDTLPGGPAERTVEYKAPFFRPDREEDYRVAWEIFQQYATVNEAV